MTDIPSRLAAVRAQVADAASRSGRDPGSILLIAVSKTKSADAIREAYGAGQRDFGENYVQEMAEKAERLADLPDLRFHFIGHLQRNKAKTAARIASVVHTVDSVRLAAELGKRAKQEGSDRRLGVLVEVNVGRETEKSGCAEGDLEGILRAIEAESALQLAGLMTVPPHTADPAGARPFFAALAALRDGHGGRARLPELSMGMSHDLEHAVAAGATIVRVGTAIFGGRGPPK